MTREITHVPPQDEMTILAMIAREDSYSEIAEKFDISKATITNIKNRNPDTLKILKEQLLTHRLNQASGILEKTNRAIEKRLDESENFENELFELQRQYRDGEIEEKVFELRVRKLQKLNISELTSISREMHSQSKTSGSGDTPPMNPQDAQEYLVKLAKGLESGDEVVLERLVFSKREQA
jgi:predicted DNA-binding protein YlxM (UPF0122 family)